MLLLLSAALAATPRDEVQALRAANAPPAMLISCSPLSSLLERAKEFSPELLADLPRKDTPILDDEAAAAALMETLLDPAAAAAAGIDLSGAVTMGLWSDHVIFDLPFSGDEAQVEALFERFPPEAREKIRRTEGGWESLQKDGESPARITLAEGRLSVRAEGNIEEARPGSSWSMLDNLPAGAGCVTYLGEVPSDTGKLSLLDGFMVFFPLEPGPFVARVNTPKPPPAALRANAARPPELRTTDAPGAVLVLNLDPLALFEALPAPKSEEAAKRREELDRVRKRISIPPGTTIGLFFPGDPKSFVGLVPVGRPNGKPLPKRKIRRGLKKMDEELEWTGRNTFRVSPKGKAVEGRVERGRVLLASDAARMAELSAGEGQPWLTPEMAAWSAEWPVAVMGSLPENPMGIEPFTLYAGLRTTEEYWEVSTYIPGGLPQSVRDRLRGLAEGRGMDKFQAMQHQAKRAEVPSYIEGIHNAEIAHNAAIGGYVGTEPAPRAVDALTADEAAWPEGSPASEAWSKLGWRPDGDTRATYWVEVAPDGASFTVHGMIDADGDGVPAHYRRTLGGEVEQVTGEDVY